MNSVATLLTGKALTTELKLRQIPLSSFVSQLAPLFAVVFKLFTGFILSMQYTGKLIFSVFYSTSPNTVKLQLTINPLMYYL